MTITDWLLDSDPTIRWQVLRDLVHAPGEVVAAERARVANEGWGARLLAMQDEDGTWAGGACFPGGAFDPPEDGAESSETPEEARAQPWISTLPTLQLLCDFGIDPQDERVRRAIAEVREKCRWEYDGLRSSACSSPERLRSFAAPPVMNFDDNFDEQDERNSAGSNDASHMDPAESIGGQGRIPVVRALVLRYATGALESTPDDSVPSAAKGWAD